MLTSYIKTFPYTKFIIIKDSSINKGAAVFNSITNQHIESQRSKIHYFICEGVLRRYQDKYNNNKNIILHDCVSDNENWINDNHCENFRDTCEHLNNNNDGDIIVINSLAHLIIFYGVGEIYQILNNLKNNNAIQQIIVLLHIDLIEDDCEKVCTIFDHLSTLSISLETKFHTDNNRLSYVYKKTGGKVFREIEEYKIENNMLITYKIEKPDVNKLIEQIKPIDINPETLSTFKISLTDEEKLSREKLILPYMPEVKKEEGKIIYEMDKMDDWDEEDPDDDLDF